ncbi:glycosyltransferase [Lactococcus formosensis subsp. bovis]|uniref:glycosyltransferase n=1 Tax=Lactococcus formosensis TaxID=1281486 RepID=UPI001BCB1BA8|nr:glycosyltransferase [Lactococcus formosensis]
MKKICFVTTTLPLIHGGRTKSLLQRAKLLNQNGIELTIVSTNYNPNYNFVYKSFKTDNKVLDNTYFCNIYDYYKEKSEKKEEKITWDKLLEKEKRDLSNLTQVYRSRKGGRTYYYSEGVPKYLIKRNEHEQIEFLAIYNDCMFSPQQYYFINHKGIVHRIDYLNYDNTLKYQEFLNNQGDVYLRREFNNKKISNIYLKKDSSDIEFLTEKDFISYFFSDIFSMDNIVICDARYLDLPLLKTPVKKRIFQLHSSHLLNPRDEASGVKKSFSNILNSKISADNVIVTLTDKQKSDIINIIPELEKNIVIIPHSSNLKQIKYTKEKKHFGTLSRLSPEKKLEDVIEAFYYFNKEVSGYFLDIYGDGECRDRLESLTNKLNISDRVIFHGNIKDTDKAYQKMGVLLITSEFEGFSLAALESISNGTSVITYDINYGPTEIIDKKSGWITDSRSPLALKEKMIEYTKFPKKSEDIQQRSLNYSEAKFVSKWLSIIREDYND